jgi:hypothetical protein
MLRSPTQRTIGSILVALGLLAAAATTVQIGVYLRRGPQAGLGSANRLLIYNHLRDVNQRLRSAFSGGAATITDAKRVVRESVRKQASGAAGLNGETAPSTPTIATPITRPNDPPSDPFVAPIEDIQISVNPEFGRWRLEPEVMRDQVALVAGPYSGHYYGVTFGWKEVQFHRGQQPRWAP